MRALRALAVACLTAIAGGFIALFSSAYLTDLYKVSNFEGGRGMLIIFFFVPVGLLIGFVVGLIFGLRSRKPGFSGFAKTLGFALASIIVLGGAVTGAAYLVASKPPLLNGKSLVLDFELKIPSTLQFPAEPSENNLHAALYTNNREDDHATIDYKAIRREDESMIVPGTGTATLMSQNSHRELLASVENQAEGTQFIPVALPAAPGKEDEKWSDWIPASNTFDLAPVPQPERILARYRVRKVPD